MTVEDLDYFIRLEDALDALDDTSCITRADYVECNKPAVQPLFAAAWDDAKVLIRKHGSLKKAANYVAKRIEELGR